MHQVGDERELRTESGEREMGNGKQNSESQAKGA